MKKSLLIAILLVAVGALALFALPNRSPALAVGDRAPNFSTLGMLGEQKFSVELDEQLKEGPVVLFFFPKAFTGGCTLESKAFADATPAFREAGARVIGLSRDDLETLADFSAEACNSIVPMAHATDDIVEDYDVALDLVDNVVPMTDRTSYVIDTDGRVALVHSDMDHDEHVARTLASVQKLAMARKL